ncbi:hypothetical protein [Brevibacterium sp. 1718]|uniref:hypothetical protein n=1 Tax=Brevibacterium sp. 1718 TaxID=3413510 RepID=UPI003DA8B554
MKDLLNNDGLCGYSSVSEVDPMSTALIIVVAVVSIGALLFWFTGYIDRPLAALSSPVRAVRVMAQVTFFGLTASFLLMFVPEAAGRFLGWLQDDAERCVQSPHLFSTALTFTLIMLIVAGGWLVQRYPPDEAGPEEKVKYLNRANSLRKVMVSTLSIASGFWVSALTADLQLLVWVPIGVAAILYAVDR